MSEFKLPIQKSSPNRIWLGENDSSEICIVYELDEANDPWRTGKFDIQFGRHIVITPTEDPKSTEEVKACLITHYTKSESLKETFSRLSSIELIKQRPSTSGGVIKIFRDLIDLFEVKKLSPEEVRGVWGELFAIHSGHSVELMCQSWNRNKKSKYDFSDQTYHLEVKTFLPNQIVATLSYEQSSVPEGCECAMLLVCTQDDPMGQSVHDLYESILSRLEPGSELAAAFIRAYTGKINADFESANLHTFDFNAAVASKTYFDMRSVPKPKCVPSEIISLKFKIDLSTVAPWDPRPDALFMTDGRNQKMLT